MYIRISCISFLISLFSWGSLAWKWVENYFRFTVYSEYISLRRIGKAFPPPPPLVYLNLCTGTRDISLQLTPFHAGQSPPVVWSKRPESQTPLLPPSCFSPLTAVQLVLDQQENRIKPVPAMLSPWVRISGWSYLCLDDVSLLRWPRLAVSHRRLWFSIPGGERTPLFATLMCFTRGT